MTWRHFFIPAGLVLSLAAGAAAQQVQWETITPATTGVPGEEVRYMTFDPEGNLWVVARWMFWEQVGLAMLPADQLAFAPPVGGGPGFDTGEWQVWSNVHYPIPSVYIYDMEFAAGGVIWLAGEGGLTRFDRSAPQNQQWVTWNNANSPLILDSVRSLDIDSEGHVWLVNMDITRADGALFEFDPVANTWTSYEVGDELPWYLPWKNISNVLVGADDHVWVTHLVLGGVAEFDGAQWVLHQSDWTMGGMLEDLQGNIWLTSGDSGLWKWNGSSFENFDLGSQGTVTALGMDAAGLVYAGSWYGDIFKMIGGTTPVFFVNARDIPGHILLHPSGDVFINNYGGNGVLGQVRHFNAAGQLLRQINSFHSGLPWYFVDRIQTDSRGNMWFATGEAGLSRFDGSRWRNFGNHNEYSEDYPFRGNEPIYGILEDSEGNIWMGGNGVARWNQNTAQFTGFWNWQNSNFGVDDMNSLAQTPDGTIWVGCGYAGAYHYDPQTNNWIQHTWGPPGGTANQVVDMLTDSQGNLWILTFIQLHRRTPQGQWATWDSVNSPLPLGSLFALEKDPAGGIWIGSQSGLHHFDGVNWTLETKAQGGWPAGNVVDIAHRPDGLLAVATQQGFTWPYTGGVSLRSGGTWTHYTPQNSPLRHWQVACVAFDSVGDLWVSPLSEGVMVMHLTPVSQPAPLTDFSVNFGSLISGGLAQIVASDDSRVRVRSSFGFTSAEPNVLDMRIGAQSPLSAPSSIDLTIEGRINQSGGTSKLRLRNWSTNGFQQVHQYSVGTTETVVQVADIAAANRVRASDQRIELSVRQSVIIVFSSAGFDSFTDWVEVRVE